MKSNIQTETMKKVPVGIFGGECEIDFAEIYEEIAFLYEKE